MKRLTPRAAWTALDWLWMVLLAAYVLLGTPLVPLHGDESTIIHATRDYAYQFIDRDLSMISYNGSAAIDPMDQDLRLLDGRVQKYLGGFFWHLGGLTADDINRPWLWGADYEYQQANGHIPSDELLLWTRLASSLLGALGVLAIFGIGGAVGGRPAAYTASLLYALHPAVLLNVRRAMMEGSLMLFSLLTVLAAVYFLRSKGRARWGWALLLGLSAGMALSSKHPGVFTVAPVFLGAFVAGLAARETMPLLLRRAGQLIMAGVLALLVFYALNPIWWGDPIARAGDVLEVRSRTLQSQMSGFDTYDGLFEQAAGFVQHALIASPQYFEIDQWATFTPITEQIAAYEASWLDGVTPGPVGAVIIALLGLLGLWRLLTTPDPARWAVGFWALGTVALTLLLTPFGWQRYYLPAIPALLVLAGLGMSQLVALALPRAQNRTAVISTESVQG
jgi:4-amino-4-deoxy-L-arabinose transferase-like glycosyltransferase